MPLLVVEKGHDKGKAIPVPSGGTVIIGRDSSTALPLRDTMTSRMHCKIQCQEDGFYLTDLESMNGTYLNGEKVRELVKLEHGDLIKIGDTLFTFQSDESTATSLAGQRVGGYRIIERVGRGGMGTVYKAEQVDLQRIVALKVISEEHTKDKDFVDLFIHEARAAAKLNHPNIVQVYDVKRHNEYYYFSMEFVSGGSVQEILNKQKKISADQSVQMVLDAAKGLDYAHKKGIIHRDVKPDNLMISETGMIKIGDMGLARGLEEKVGPEEETSVIGTPHYIAPEQVLGRPADFRSDIYSLGATAYRMLAGVTPFSAPSVRDLVNKKVREDAASIVEHSPEVPKAVAEIVARMMARDPDRRYQGMGEVITDLERYQRGQAEVLTEARREHTTAVGMMLSNRKAMVIAALALFALIGSAVLIASLYQKPDPEVGRPKVPVVDPQAATQALYVVRRTEVDMNRTESRSIERVIADYANLVERFPGTPAAKEAGERKASLEVMLRDVRAKKKLELAELEEIAQYRRAIDAFQPKRPDLSAIDAAISAYQTVSRADDMKGTEAAQEAAQRASGIRKWKAALEQRRDDYEQSELKAEAALRQKKFRDAGKIWIEFRDDTKRAETDFCPFAKDRYRSLLYDAPAAVALTKVGLEARAAWPQQEADARALAREKSYEGAIELLKDVIGSSVDEVAQLAKTLRESLESEWASVQRMEDEQREALRAKKLAEARAAFAQESLAARDLVLKYDFKAALAKIKGLRDINMAEDLRPRIERRILELERCARFKDSLIGAIKSKGSQPSKFKLEIDPQSFGGLEGTIEDADDRTLQIRLSAGGVKYHGWTEFDPPQFHKFVMDQWKYSKEQRRDITDQNDLAAVCMEFGLYEKALEAIQVSYDLMQDPVAQIPPAAKAFVEEYPDRIRRGESAEFSEIEAKKRIARLKDFMTQMKYPAAKAELDILHIHYWKTNEVQGQQQQLQDLEKKISKEGGESLNTAVKADRLKALLAKVAEEQMNARKAQGDIVSRIGRMEDPFEKNFHLGSVYAAAGDFRTSTEKYREASKVGDAMIAAGRTSNEFMRTLGVVYGEMYRNAVLLKDKKTAESIRNQGSQRFVNPDTKAEEEWWSQIALSLANWSESSYPLQEKNIVRLRDELKKSPEDAAQIWSLAQTCSDGVFNLVEARGYYAWLAENHPEFPQVQNGTCQYKLAELYYAAREVREARKQYQNLERMHRDHPMVSDNGARGVRRRIDECFKIATRMNYTEKPK